MILARLNRDPIDFRQSKRDIAFVAGDGLHLALR